jgi:plasmid stabilization system protein ParE
MKDITKVVWSERAVSDLKNIISYLEENLTEKEISKFTRKLEKQISIIREQPTAFVATKHNNVRRSVMLKQVTLYYHVEDSTVRIVTLFDNRQNPFELQI